MEHRHGEWGFLEALDPEKRTNWNLIGILDYFLATLKPKYLMTMPKKKIAKVFIIRVGFLDHLLGELPWSHCWKMSTGITQHGRAPISRQQKHHQIIKNVIKCFQLDIENHLSKQKLILENWHFFLSLHCLLLHHEGPTTSSKSLWVKPVPTWCVKNTRRESCTIGTSWEDQGTSNSSIVYKYKRIILANPHNQRNIFAAASIEGDKLECSRKTLRLKGFMSNGRLVGVEILNHVIQSGDLSIP